MCEERSRHVGDFVDRCQLLADLQSSMLARAMTDLAGRVPAHLPCRAICMGVLLESLARHNKMDVVISSSVEALLKRAADADADLKAGSSSAPSLHRLGDVIPLAARYIEANACRPDLKLADVAQHCGVSRCHLSRLLSAAHLPFAEEVQRRRLLVAAGLLRTTTVAIKEIAYRSGFLSAAAFANRFKSAYGCSAGQYRQRHDVI
jgi:AraC-like DNA-binding protein